MPHGLEKCHSQLEFNTCHRLMRGDDTVTAVDTRASAVTAGAHLWGLRGTCSPAVRTLRGKVV